MAGFAPKIRTYGAVVVISLALGVLIGAARDWVQTQPPFIASSLKWLLVVVFVICGAGIFAALFRRNPHA
jgi:hypothetical protein